MAIPPVSLGYVILYVEDVASSLAFYETAFGLSRRFFQEADGQAYGELETGATRLAFASLRTAAAHLKMEVTPAAPDGPPLGVEIAFTTPDVQSSFEHAVSSGAIVVSEPATKPWGQTVAYLRDSSGHLVELCTPLP